MGGGGGVFFFFHLYLNKELPQYDLSMSNNYLSAVILKHEAIMCSKVEVLVSACDRLILRD